MIIHFISNLKQVNNATARVQTTSNSNSINHLKLFTGHHHNAVGLSGVNLRKDTVLNKILPGHVNVGGVRLYTAADLSALNSVARVTHPFLIRTQNGSFIAHQNPASFLSSQPTATAQVAPLNTTTAAISAGNPLSNITHNPTHLLSTHLANFQHQPSHQQRSLIIKQQQQQINSQNQLTAQLANTLPSSSQSQQTAAQSILAQQQQLLIAALAQQQQQNQFQQRTNHQLGISGFTYDTFVGFILLSV